MAQEFEETLDRCISLVLQGVTVQECLARYPEHAGELEPQLQAVARLAAAYNREPSSVAFQRSRQRLQAEMAALSASSSGEASRGPARAARFGLWTWGRRWALATAALVLVILLGGWTTVAAASASIPGERLYPVKRALEQVRLAVELSDAGKAELEFAYVERRANEMAVLIAQDNVALAEETAAALDRQLAAASQRAAAADVASAAALAAKLEASASRVLPRLEDAVARAPVSSRSESSRLLEVVAGEYAQASESLATVTEHQYVPGESGRLQLFARLVPPAGVPMALVDVSDVEAYLAAGVHSRWVAVGQGVRTIGTFPSADSLLGELEVESGLYSRVRFRIVAVTVVTASGRETLPPPEGPVELQRPFSVAPGQTAFVLLDFDGMRSIVRLPEGGLGFVPEVTVRVLDEPPLTGPPPTPTPAPGITPTPSPRPTPTGPRPTPGPGPTPSPATVEISGLVEQVATTRLVVAGQEVALSQDTQVSGVPAIGVRVRVTGERDASGVLMAIRVVVETSPAPEATTTRTPAPRPSPSPPQTPTPTPTPTPIASGQPVVVTGTIASLAPGLWTVDSTRVMVDASTVIVGLPLLGLSVRVEGVAQADGTVLATRVEVLAGPPASPTPSPPLPSPIPTPTPTPASAPTATPIASGQPVVVTGTIASLSPGLWIVDSTRVVVNASTVIVGLPLVGVQVRVEGVAQADGAVLATRIEVLASPPPAPAPSPPPVPAPTPTPTLAPAPTPTPTPQTTVLIGTLTSISPGLWTVDGVKVVVNAQTVIEGLPLVGLRVRVEGAIQPDGSLLATRITVLP